MMRTLRSGTRFLTFCLALSLAPPLLAVGLHPSTSPGRTELVLTLDGERRFEKAAEDTRYHCVERSYGRFSRVCSNAG